VYKSDRVQLKLGVIAQDVSTGSASALSPYQCFGLLLPHGNLHLPHIATEVWLSVSGNTVVSAFISAVDQLRKMSHFRNMSALPSLVNFLR
jgi:hypothetical protein